MAKRRPEPVKYRVKNIKKYKGDPTQVWARSSWEKICMNWLDLHPRVVEWSSEETVVPYKSPVDEKIHRYFVDFKVTFEVNGIRKTYLIEIKPRKERMPPIETKRKMRKTLLEEVVTYKINQAKWAHAEEYCRQRGWTFIILDEYDLGIAREK